MKEQHRTHTWKIHLKVIWIPTYLAPPSELSPHGYHYIIVAAWPFRVDIPHKHSTEWQRIRTLPRRPFSGSLWKESLVTSQKFNLLRDFFRKLSSRPRDQKHVSLFCPFPEFRIFQGSFKSPFHHGHARFR